MKLTDQEIRKMILEILNEQDSPDDDEASKEKSSLGKGAETDTAKKPKSDFGKAAVSRTDSAKNLRQRTRDAVSQKGVDNMERGIIQQVENNLSKLADITNLRSGNTFAFLKKLNALIEKEIQKIEGGVK